MFETKSKFSKKTMATMSAVMALSLLAAACGAPAQPAAPAAPAAPIATEAPKAEAPTEEAKPTEAPAEEAKPTEAPAAAGEVKDFVTWYQYDEKNEDPKSDERVGNEYLRKTIPLFNDAFKGKWNWVNQPQAFDKMATNLVAAVQAGGEVPDLMQAGNDEMLKFFKNGAAEDLTDWIKAQPWFSDLEPAGVNACTLPDGKIYCVPVAITPQVVFYWSDHYPEGYPKTPEDFLKQAEELKKKNVYALTFLGSTDFDGLGTERFIWTAISSFGGTFDDGTGKMTLNTPENVKAVEFIRELVSKGYAPEAVFAGKFLEEEPMKTAEAASFPTGIFGYRYVNPLKAPSGKEYNKGNENDMLDAIAAGDVKLAPFIAPEGKKPGCGLGATGFIIPKGAKNKEAAYDYINWIMSKEQNAAWVQGPGGGFPVLKSTLSDPIFQTPFYEQAAAVVEASACRPWWGSLERKDEAQKIIMTAIYKLIKEDPTADIAETLKAAEEEYNKGG